MGQILHGSAKTTHAVRAEIQGSKATIAELAEKYDLNPKTVTEWRRLHMFVVIDRASKFAFVELHDRATRRNASEFLRRLIKAVPYKVHTVLTDNGVQFTTPGNVASAAKDIREALERGELVWAYGFELVCAQNDIDHRLNKPNPWTNGQVERMNRTLKEATVRRFYYDDHCRCAPS